MQAQAFIEIRDLKIGAQIGTYGPQDMIPRNHILDLKFTVAHELVLIADDSMEYVFDYDPLVTEIHRLAQACFYETQEKLITLIVNACAQYAQIQTLTINLRKSPVYRGTGSLGVSLIIDHAYLQKLRHDPI